MLNRPERAKPNLTMAVISIGYRDAYIAAYHSGYRIQSTHEDRAAVDKLNCRVASNKINLNKTDRLFELGWEDGYAGNITPSKNLNPDQRVIWDRGQKIGFRDRDYERARQLRQRRNHQSQARSQDNRGR